MPFFGVLIVKLWLVGDQYPLPRFWGHDDLLFVNWAIQLVNGNWLGDYNMLTLVKLPGYAFWIAGAKLSGIPLLVSQHLAQALAAAIVCWALAKNGVSSRTNLLAFTLIVLSPESHSYDQATVMREYLYGSLAIILFGLLLVYLSEQRKSVLLAVSLIHGIVLAFFSIIREEFIWIIPLYLAFLFCYFFFFRKQLGSRQILSRLGLLFLVGIFAVFALHWQLRNINFRKYGIAQTIVRGPTSGSYSQAYRSLSRIEAGEKIQFVPLTKQMRDLAYAASPSFAKLQPAIEQYIAEGNTPDRSSVFLNKGELTIGSLDFVIMTAAAQLGHFDSGQNTIDFFANVAEEIDSACIRGLIPCGPLRQFRTPNFSVAFLPDFFRYLASNLASLAIPKFIFGELVEPYGLLELMPYYSYITGHNYDSNSVKKLQAIIGFDRDYYINGISGQQTADIDPLEHFFIFGAEKGLAAGGNSDSLRFDRQAYANAHPELRGTGITLLQHYFSGMKGRPVFVETGQSRRGVVRSYLQLLQALVMIPAIVFGFYFLGNILLQTIKNGIRSISHEKRFFAAFLILSLTAVFSRVVIVSFVNATAHISEEAYRYMLPAHAFYTLFAVGAAILFIIGRQPAGNR